MNILVTGSTGVYGDFFESSPSGGCLAGVVDFGVAVIGNLLGGAARATGDATQAHQVVEGASLGDEDAADIASDFEERLPGGDLASFLGALVESGLGVEVPENRLCEGDAAGYSFASGHNGGSDGDCCFKDGFSGDVSIPHVFGDGELDEGLYVGLSKRLFPVYGLWGRWLGHGLQ